MDGQTKLYTPFGLIMCSFYPSVVSDVNFDALRELAVLLHALNHTN